MPDPIAFQIGPLVFRWYGLLIVIGALLGAWVASREAERRGIDPDHIWNALTLVLLAGILGARLYHVISSPAGEMAGWRYYFIEQPFIDVTILGRTIPFPSALAIWRGGLGIYGGVAAGALTVWWYARRHNLPLLDLLDVGAIGLLIGQAIGRWGNYFNQELYGNPTNLPWGIHIDLEHRLPQFADLPLSTRFHPTFLYESLWNAIGVVLLLWVSRRYADRLRRGDIFLLYLIWYPLGRFLVEFQRPDAWKILGLPTAQWIAIVSIGVAAFLLWRRHQRPPAEGEVLLDVMVKRLPRAQRRALERKKRES
ncbi:prolipoprotein diacylglyceryl transferase [Ardenticatena maritima]|uniref:prolipoprotein diacylglyceryl transferase n=2 Tax=Ardenticatena maritima TaxID=872965 RepID=UPI0009EC8078|nr:prolipoprotein diacylglyceryl transferase [Ardenticatena maritima]